MIGIKWLMVGALMPCAAATAQDVPPEYRDYQAALRNRGLAAIIPLSTAFAPGYIYRLERNTVGQTFVRRICTQAFMTRPETEQISLPTSQSFKDNGINLALKLLPDSLAGKLGAALKVGWGTVKTVDVNLSGITSYQVAAANDFNPVTHKVVERTMNPACLANLGREELVAGKFRQRTFMVIRATAAAGFNYTLNKDRNAGIDLTAAIPTIGNAEAGWKLKKTTKQSFKADRDAGQPPLFFAADIVQIPSVDAVNRVASGAKGSFVTAAPEAGDLDALAGATIAP